MSLQQRNLAEDTVEDVVLKMLSDRGYGADEMKGLKTFFSFFEGFQSGTVAHIFQQPDTRKLGRLPDVTDWCHFVSGEMLKLVQVLFTHRKAVESSGFSTELATKFMSTLSRPSPSSFVQSVVSVSASALPAKFVSLTEKKVFWVFFDAMVVMTAYYGHTKLAFSILNRLCEISAGLGSCWGEVVPLLHFFEPNARLSKVSDGEKVQMLVETLQKMGHTFTIGIPSQCHDALRQKIPLSASSPGLPPGDEDNKNQEEEELTGWNFALPVDVLVNNRQCFDKGTRVYVKYSYSAEGENMHHLEKEMESLEDVIYQLVTLGKRVKAEKESAKKKLTKKQQAKLDSRDPKGMQVRRYAFNMAKSILRGKGSGTEIYGKSLNQALLESDGWMTVRSVESMVQSAPNVQQQSEAYSGLFRPMWLEEMMEDHDIVGRHQSRVRADGVRELRATHGHQGEADKLYRKILKQSELRYTRMAKEEDEPPQRGWLYEKFSLERMTNIMEKLKVWKTSSHPGFRVLFTETVESAQAYRKQFADFQQLDQDFSNSEGRQHQGYFLEVDMARLEQNYELFISPTQKAIYAFSPQNENPPFVIPLWCFTGRIWKLGEDSIAQFPILEEAYDKYTSTARANGALLETPQRESEVPTSPAAVMAGEGKILAAEQAFELDERSAREDIEALLSGPHRTLTVKLRKGLFLYRKERVRELKRWIYEKHLLYEEDKSDPHFTIFKVFKPDLVTRDECSQLREYLQLPNAFNIELLQRAVTISDDNHDNYEQFEFVGDAVLGCIVAVDKLTQVASRFSSSTRQEKTNETADGGPDEAMTALTSSHISVSSDDCGAGQERAVVSIACANQVIAHLLPPLLAERFQDKGLKVKADVVEALIGAVYEGECGLDAVRTIVKRLYERVPEMLRSDAGITLSEDEKHVLQQAWNLSPYRPPDAIHEGNCLKFNIVRVLPKAEMESSQCTGVDAHSAMIGFCRIQMKTFATHFTSGDVFCYRRIFPEDIPDIRNRIVCGAETEMTFVNELITNRMRFVIDFDGASIFSFNFYYYLLEWTAKRTNGTSRVFVASSSGKDKESYHIHFLRWIEPMKNYECLIKDLESFVRERKEDFFLQLLNALNNSDMKRAKGISIGTSTLIWSNPPPNEFSFLNSDDLKNALESGAFAAAALTFQTTNWISPFVAAQRFRVPHHQVMLGEVKGNATELILLTLPPRQGNNHGDDTDADPHSEVSKATYSTRWILGRDLYEQLNIIFNPDEGSELKQSIDESYLDAGLAGSQKLRMMLCDKFDMRKGRVYRPVYPYLLSDSGAARGYRDHSACSASSFIRCTTTSPSARLLDCPVKAPLTRIATLPTVMRVDVPTSQKQLALFERVKSIGCPRAHRSIKDLLRREGDEVQEEVWDEAYGPAVLRKQFNRRDVKPMFMGCMDAVVLSSLRESIVRDVTGRPYSSWNAIQQQQAKAFAATGDKEARREKACAEAGRVFAGRGEGTVQVSRWKLPYDVCPRRFYREAEQEKDQHQVLLDSNESRTLKAAALVENRRVIQCMQTRLSLWLNILKLGDEFLPLARLVDYADEEVEITRKRNSNAKPRCLLPTWIIREDLCDCSNRIIRLSFLVAGEVVVQSNTRRGDTLENAFMSLGRRLVRWFTPHFPAPLPADDTGLTKVLDLLIRQPIFAAAFPLELPRSICERTLSSSSSSQDGAALAVLPNRRLGLRVEHLPPFSSLKTFIEEVALSLLPKSGADKCALGTTLFIVVDAEDEDEVRKKNTSKGAELSSALAIQQNLAIFFPEVWRFSECHSQFRWRKVHEYSTIFLIHSIHSSSSINKVGELTSWIRVHCSAALNKCEVYCVNVQ